MSKRARTILSFILLYLSIVTSIVLLASAVFAFNFGNPDLSINYNLITQEQAIAGRHYTPTCLGTCDLVFSLSYTGTNAPASAIIDSSKLTTQFNWIKGQDKFQSSKIYYLYEYQEQVIDYSTICNSYTETDPINSTVTEYPNCSQVASGSHIETRKEWQELSSLTLEKDKTYYFDVRGKFSPNSDFSVDVIPDITISGTKFIMSEMAVWEGTLFRECANYTLGHNATGEISDAIIRINNIATDGSMSIRNFTLETWAGNSNATYKIQTYNTTENKFNLTTIVNYTDGDILSVCWGNNTYSNAAYAEIIQTLNRTVGMDRWGFEEYANASNLNGWYNISTGGTETTSNIEVSDFGKRNDTRGMYDKAQVTSSGVITRNFSYIITNPAFVCMEYYDAGLTGQPGFGISNHTTWATGSNGVIDDWITFYGTTATIKYGGNETTTTKNAITSSWNYICISYYDNGYIDVYLNGTKINNQPKLTLSGTPSRIYERFFIFLNNDKPRWDSIISSKGRYYGASANVSAVKTVNWSSQGISNYATESQGDSAIQQGIANSTINSSSSNYTSQQIYIRNVTGSQQLGRFDVLASSGNQRWAFNYVTSNDPTSSFTYMVNITPTIYVWEAANLTSAQISSQVQAFIDSTKV